MTAPVDPALMKASAPPSWWSRIPCTMEESGFRRTAAAGGSEARIRSGAWWMWSRGEGAHPDRASSASMAAWSPTRTISMSSPSSSSASNAPATSVAGAWSVPMASRAMRTGSAPIRRSRRRSPPHHGSAHSSGRPGEGASDRRTSGSSERRRPPPCSGCGASACAASKSASLERP